MSKPYIIILGLWFSALVNCDNPFHWERDLQENDITRDIVRNTDGAYRLPGNVVPLEYDVHLDLFFDERPDRPFSYSGRVSVMIQAVEENVNQVVLHSNVDNIHSITILSNSGAPYAVDVWNPFTLEPQYHFLKINLVEPLEVGANYTLLIEYSSTMNEGPMKRGIWRGWYTDDDGVERIYATTHFQPYNARQAFPCWDEPLYKAIFTLHISRPTSYEGRFSNTQLQTMRMLGNGRVQDNFLPTPRMSSYLVTFLVSETFQVIAQNTSFNPPIRIIGRSNTAGLGNHALNLAVKMTEYFDEYFGIPYETLHPNLLNDHISSPDWASAGTENWGMVSYRELYLIIDRSETLMSVEHYAATLVSHELAHKWFGNLITCYWWSNTWINEGFASYFGYMATHQVFPEYEFHEHFNARYLQNSLAYDSGSTEPMNHEVNTPAQVTGHFGTISYSKGAAFLRMTHDLISAETFRKACRYFLINNEFEPTDQFDLYNAFAQATAEDRPFENYMNFNFTDYYRIWVNEPGYPILNVDINYSNGEMALQQERFFLSGANPTNQVYPIPITYSTSRNPNFENLKPIAMMDAARIVLTKDAGEEWVIFNNLQHGHYRVNYDRKTWELITDALVSDPESIHYMNRAQIVNDVFALMRSRRMTHLQGFQVIKFLQNETNYHVWNSAISGYTWLRNRFRHMPEKRAEFDSYILRYMESIFNSVVDIEPSSTTSPTLIMTVQDILHFTCGLDYEDCVKLSHEKFIALRDAGESVNIGIRRNVYLTGMREGGQQDFQFLLNRLQNSNYANDQLEKLRALGATRDPTLLNQYLELTLTKLVRSHDKVNSFNYALLGNIENAPTVLQFVKNNIDAMRIAYVQDSPANPVQSALSSLATYLNEAELDEYERWLRETQSQSAQFTGTLNAINSARTNIAWGTANVDDVLEAARASAGRIGISLVMLLVTLVARLSV